MRFSIDHFKNYSTGGYPDENRGGRNSGHKDIGNPNSRKSKFGVAASRAGSEENRVSGKSTKRFNSLDPRLTENRPQGVVVPPQSEILPNIGGNMGSNMGAFGDNSGLGPMAQFFSANSGNSGSNGPSNGPNNGITPGMHMSQAEYQRRQAEISGSSNAGNRFGDSSNNAFDSAFEEGEMGGVRHNSNSSSNPHRLSTPENLLSGNNARLRLVDPHRM